MQGFSVPRSPQGRTSLTPPPPWFYAGNLLLIDYAADPQAVAAVLPPGLAPDPVRSQYHEFLVLVKAPRSGPCHQPPCRASPGPRPFAPLL
jgi:hypothetical protein